MKITLWCNHSVWLKRDEKFLECGVCHVTKALGEKDPQVKMAWGFAKDEQVVRDAENRVQ